ncbi:MAG: hypothetical protein R2867_33580 [Caldilineaceae bacterium]
MARWNTLQEFVVRTPEKTTRHDSVNWRHAGTARCAAGYPQREHDAAAAEIAELNRVWWWHRAGRLCVGRRRTGVFGKSTILIQMAAEIAQSVGPVLYVSAEESAHQVGRRAARLGIQDDKLLCWPRSKSKALSNSLSR